MVKQSETPGSNTLFVRQGDELHLRLTDGSILLIIGLGDASRSLTTKTRPDVGPLATGLASDPPFGEHTGVGTFLRLPSDAAEEFDALRLSSADMTVEVLPEQEARRGIMVHCDDHLDLANSLIQRALKSDFPVTFEVRDQDGS
jgi:hypothetical protein